MAIDPSFAVPISGYTLHFLKLHLHRITDAPPAMWPHQGRLAFVRLECAVEALDNAKGQRTRLTRTEAGTLIAFSQRMMQDRLQYPRIKYRGEEEDWPRQLDRWLNKHAEVEYPGSLIPFVQRLEVLTGLRQAL